MSIHGIKVGLSLHLLVFVSFLQFLRYESKKYKNLLFSSGSFLLPFCSNIQGWVCLKTSRSKQIVQGVNLKKSCSSLTSDLSYLVENGATVLWGDLDQSVHQLAGLFISPPNVCLIRETEVHWGSAMNQRKRADSLRWAPLPAPPPPICKQR